MNPAPITAGPDDTLRVVRARFAAFGITAAPVVEPTQLAPPHTDPFRPSPPRLVGLITVEHLLDGRLPDLAEEHHRARVLRSGSGQPPASRDPAAPPRPAEAAGDTDRETASIISTDGT